MMAWILLGVMLVAIAVVLWLVRPRDDFLRLGRDPRDRRIGHDLAQSKRSLDR